ncbi:ATP-binding protein [Georgenia ruanii]|uniref:ATP-binding protein n=1 Tax=Georgenia ruanii TaxID=348442 RepID=UPI001D006A7F|nr:ATP-binding protein [Georgenia ruanii]
MPSPDAASWSSSEAPSWVNTTHDWAAGVDRAHLAAIRRAPDAHAPGGALHLVLEVLAYADDEAEALGRRGRCRVTVHEDGSIRIADDGRGTDTRRDRAGRVIKKPVMATKDLRFFDAGHDALLPDGRPRRGMSVVAALSRWLVHTNRRHDGAWTQRYEHGLPVTDLVPLDDRPDGVDDRPGTRTGSGAHAATGTTVHFLVDHHLVDRPTTTPDEVRAAARFSWLSVEVTTGAAPT